MSVAATVPMTIPAMTPPVAGWALDEVVDPDAAPPAVIAFVLAIVEERWLVDMGAPCVLGLSTELIEKLVVVLVRRLLRVH